MNKKVLALAAAGEAGMGLLLLAWPPLVVRLLFGAEISGAGVIMSRIAGIALIGLGVSCWPGDSALQPLNGMLTYSTLALLYLTYIGSRGKWSGCYYGRQLCSMQSSSLFSSVRGQSSSPAKGISPIRNAADLEPLADGGRSTMSSRFHRA